MPKISGPSIAEHVVSQEAAVFAAATRLFGEQGVDNVSMGMIAEEVGLARSSLYRYFPTKAAIVYRWFELSMTTLIDDCDRIAASGRASDERFTTWIERQIEFLSEPANRAMIDASIATTELSPAQRDAMSERHRDLYASLAAIIGRGDANHTTTHVRVLLIVGLLRSHSTLADPSVPVETAHRELLRAVRLIAALD